LLASLIHFVGGYDVNGRFVKTDPVVGYLETADGRVQKYVPGKERRKGKKTVIGWWNR
jgi:hypothetical protein